MPNNITRCSECGANFSYPVHFCVHCLEKREARGPQKTEDRYKVVRFFRKSGRRRVICWDVSLAVARAHCSNPASSRPGVWFDGFEKRTEKARRFEG